MYLSLAHPRNQAKEGLERVKDPGFSACVGDVESRVEDEAASMQEVLVDENAGGKSRRVLFGIDLIDRILQDDEGKCDRHGSLECEGSRGQYTCSRNKGCRTSSSLGDKRGPSLESCIRYPRCASLYLCSRLVP